VLTLPPAGVNLMELPIWLGVKDLTQLAGIASHGRQAMPEFALPQDAAGDGGHQGAQRLWRR
jgi:hypothetical protein